MIADARADFLYVGRNDGAIQRIDTLTRAETTFASGFNDPTGLAFDLTGNLYVATNQGAIDRVTPGGVVSVFANTGRNQPQGLAFDSSGNLYVSGDSDDSIERITPGGVVSVFAGGLSNLPYGLAFDSSGNLFVSLAGGNIDRITPGGAVSVFANTFSVSGGVPDRQLTFDSAGNLYGANAGSGKIDRITTGGVVSVFSNPGVGSEMGLAFDSMGNLFSAGAATISRITPGGVSTTFATEPLNLAYLAIQPSAVPEPSSLIMLGVGLVGAIGFHGRRKALRTHSVSPAIRSRRS